MPNEQPAQPDIVAAGGVLWREAEDGVEIALVHRPRYDDWSLPKGKCDPGEHIATTAWREILEETGYHCALGRRLLDISYRTSNGALKRVYYFSARKVTGSFEANDEVDELHWVSVAKGIQALSYAEDAEVLREFDHLQPPVHHIALIRHAHAGDRSGFTGPDTQRPLSSKGEAQSQWVTSVLPAFAPTRMYSATVQRCLQTIEPLSQQLGLSVRTSSAFDEAGFAGNPMGMVEGLREIAAKRACSVVCSQGGAIPGAIAMLGGADGLPLTPELEAKKGSMWLLTFAERTLVAADYYPSLQPFRD